MADLRRIGSTLERVGAGVSLMSRNEGNRKSGMMRLNEIQRKEEAALKADAAATEKAQAISREIKMKILDASTEAYQRPDLTEEQRFQIGTDIAKLGKDLEIDVSPYLNLPPESSLTKPQTLSPGAQLVGPDGKLIAENKNVRTQTGEFERLAAIPEAERTPEQIARLNILTTRAPRAQPRSPGFKEQVKAETDGNFQKAEQEFAKGDSLAASATYANRFIDKKISDGLMGVGEAGKLRDQVRRSTGGLIEFDRAYKRADEILSKNPAAATGGAPQLSKALTTATNSALGLLELIPGVGPGLTTSMDDWQDELNAIAGDNRELQSVIFNIAIQEAISSGLADGRMSNDDIERTLNDIGSTSKTPAALKRRFAEVRARMASGLKTRLDVTVEDFSGLSDADPVTTAPTAPTSRIDALRQKYGR